MVKQTIIQTIKQYETIIIHRHVRPDADALGSQCGLKKMIQLSFPEKKVYAVGEEDPALHFLARMDEVDDTLFSDALIIICDTANTGRISDERYKLADKIIKIDHHPNNDPYGDIMWVDTSASSTSEMIYELFLYGKNQPFKMDEQIARLIYGGIVGDTGRFLFPSTSNKTFQYAAQLIEYPFDRPKLYNGLYSIGQNIARLRGYILENFTMSPSGVSTVKLTKDILNKYEVEPIDTGKLVGALGDIEHIKAWIFFIEEDDIIRVRIRSKGPIINTLAAKYNGGGHPLAAGASVKTWAEAEQFVLDLENICANVS
ncbi:bifunctional oligoribonuclease/PAP phosphatase NrnA [Pseudogracilibacillus auburnensis]|uniref:Phosphoesterase RecJ-like protein n=1 Tax=Pseudogracilibacillus auburnensis TaxID=1494959 RepID=A0A2V3VTU1_9BACI|nr:bifunctional oligoribonuclease/PAP phosphatase NrnA [Pseudogracilibacillus auburnensis]MBO1003388.1 bifunctional oligoribonuclease/PAP phosphatase NrnA [Pseudogracilibacillus auburnensis]PXW85307.1 phosphoesterase RecJ-like protein [Pseudogracilibacillus auburnensis]